MLGAIYDSSGIALPSAYCESCFIGLLFLDTARYIRSSFIHIIMHEVIFHPGSLSDANIWGAASDRWDPGPNKRRRRPLCFTACLMEGSVLLNLDITILISHADPHRILHTIFSMLCLSSEDANTKHKKSGYFHTCRWLYLQQGWLWRRRVKEEVVSRITQRCPVKWPDI